MFRILTILGYFQFSSFYTALILYFLLFLKDVYILRKKCVINFDTDKGVYIQVRPHNILKICTLREYKK